MDDKTLLILNDTLKFLEHVASNTENGYVWREACGLIREIDLLIDPNDPKYLIPDKK